MISLRVSLAVLSLTLSAHAQYAFHFEFDEPGVLPSATPGVGAGNHTGTPTAAMFSAGCGTLLQRTTINPTLGVFFYSGSFLSYPPIGAGLDPGQPAFLEARFKQVGGTGGPGTVPDSTAVLGLYPGAATNMAVNVVTGAVGMLTIGGFLWTMPTGGTTVAHTYRLETFPAGGSTYCMLSIDGVLVLGPALAAPATTADGWFFGDGAGSDFISQDLDWEYVSVAQAPANGGQANSPEAALFVNRDARTIGGMPGLSGPFLTVAPSGSTVTLEWNGPAFAPFALYSGPLFPTGPALGCSGWIDLGWPVTQLFDPFAPWSGLLFQLDGCGYAKQTFLVPPLPPSFPLLSVQGLVFQPSGCPFVLTAAHFVTT